MKQFWMHKVWLFGLLFYLPSCGDPCKDLAEKICRCERYEQDRHRCLMRVRALANQYTPNPNKQIEQASHNLCASLIDLCTCDTLASGNLKACGLSTTE